MTTLKRLHNPDMSYSAPMKAEEEWVREWVRQSKAKRGGWLAKQIAEMHASIPQEAWKDVPDTSEVPEGVGDRLAANPAG